MISLVRADLFKTRKRAMGWVMLIIIALFVPLQMLATAFTTPTKVNYSFPGVLLQGLDPVGFLGPLLLIILGAVIVGSEYGYDTWKNLLTRRADRVPFIISKWLVLMVAIGIGLIVLVPFGLALGLALNAALHLTGPIAPLSLGSVLVIILLQALTPLMAGSIAIMGAVIGRSSVAGIIAGIVWFLVDFCLVESSHPQVSPAQSGYSRHNSLVWCSLRMDQLRGTHQRRSGWTTGHYSRPPGSGLPRDPYRYCRLPV